MRKGSRSSLLTTSSGTVLVDLLVDTGVQDEREGGAHLLFFFLVCPSRIY